MKTTATTIGIWLFMLFVTGSSLKLYIDEKANSRRLTNNLETVNQEVERYKTRDGHQAARIDALVLTNRELKRSFPGMASTLKNLYIPPQRVESFTETSNQLKIKVTAPVKDTVLQLIEPRGFSTVINRDTVHFLDYADEWIKIHAEMMHNTGTVEVAATDTIFTAIHRGERRRPWSWIFSRRKLQTSVTNRNPYISINVIQSGVIKK